jgi:glucose/arabinose dehydrogenase
MFTQGMHSSCRAVRSKLVAVASALALTLGLACAADGTTRTTGSTGSALSSVDRGGTQTSRPAPHTPALTTRVVMGGLDVPWDIAILPDGSWLVTERDRLRITIRHADGSRDILADGPPHFWASGETGLMSIVADPDFVDNRRFYTCGGFVANGNPGIRVYAWELSDDESSAQRLSRPLLKGIQITSGRHGGCRLRFDPDGALYVGTGDSAVGTNPQDLHSLNGKVLRINRFTGKPAAGNPWIHAKNKKKRYIYNYGHRNIQGLAWRPGDVMWTVEHGTDRDDEVNRAVKGGDYGWNPVPGYNESVPMTDFSLPGRQIGAKWQSGFPTIATSGATWVRGKQWGAYRGSLAVCALAGSRLLFMKFSNNKGSKLLWTKTPGALNGDYGRLRSVVQTKAGALLVTTSNGGLGAGGDRIVKVTPR